MYNNSKKIIITAGVALSLVFGTAGFAFAQEGVYGSSASTQVVTPVKPIVVGTSARSDDTVKPVPKTAATVAAQTAIQKRKNAANKEIENRVDTLQKLTARIESMKKISPNDQAALARQIQSHVSELSVLKSTIDADTSTTTLKASEQSITKSYRTYALVMPRTNIIAAADRIKTLAAQMSELETKLRVRLAQATSTPSAAVQGALTDFATKIADAQTQAQNAENEVSGLQPDNGDKTIFASNLKALRDAQSKIQTARKDLETARKDIAIIQRSLPKIPPTVSNRQPASTTRQQ